MKFYNIELILFVDSKDYNYLDILDIVRTKCSYAYILHDKDEDKKPHYHVQCYFLTQHTLSAYSKLFGIPQNMIQVIKNKVGAIQYLIHKNNPEKYQYDINDISTNFDIAKFFDNRVESENQCIYDLITYITNSKQYIYLRTFYNYVLNNNYWSYYRRNAFMINELIKEQNLLTSNDKFDNINL